MYSTYSRLRKTTKKIFLSVLLLLFILPAQSAPRGEKDNPPINTSSMPDSVQRLLQDIFLLIDSMAVKETTPVVVKTDSAHLPGDTIIITTTFVEDTIMANAILSQLDSIMGNENTDEDVVIKADTDTLKKTSPAYPPLQMCAEARALLAANDRDSILAAGDGFPINAIFLPVVFDGQRPDKQPSLHNTAQESESSGAAPYALTRRKNAIEEDMEWNSIGRYAQAVTIIEHPELVRYTPEMLPKAIHVERMKKQRETLTIREVFTPQISDVKGRDIKLKHWLSNFQSALQVSQIYISENWYQGGTSNINLLSTQGYTLKYNDYKENIIFENKVQWNLNISNAPDDTLRNYSISEDLFRIDSKFGYKAIRNFYYSASFYFKTQFFNNYKKNTHTRTASFLSPGELSLNFGMTYNYTSKDKSFTTSVSASPLSYNLKTRIDKEMLEGTKFGIEEGRKTLHKVGSSFDANIKWQFMRNMHFSSRLYYFTSYERVQIDFENTFNFILNRYFSTRIEFKLRYDDSIEPNSKGSYVQIKELLSFGLFFKI